MGSNWNCFQPKVWSPSAYCICTIAWSLILGGPAPPTPPVGLLGRGGGGSAPPWPPSSYSTVWVILWDRNLWPWPHPLISKLSMVRQMLLLTENCWQYKKQCLYKGRGVVSMPICANKVRNGLASTNRAHSSCSQPRQLPCAQCIATKHSQLHLSHTYFQKLHQLIANMRPN